MVKNPSSVFSLLLFQTRVVLFDRRSYFCWGVPLYVRCLLGRCVLYCYFVTQTLCRQCLIFIIVFDILCFAFECFKQWARKCLNSVTHSNTVHEKTKTNRITKTCLYNFDTLKPHFCRVNLGFTGVYINFLIFAQKIYCGYPLEPPCRGGSNEYPHSIFWAKIRKNICSVFVWKFSSLWRWNFLYIWIGEFS